MSILKKILQTVKAAAPVAAAAMPGRPGAIARAAGKAAGAIEKATEKDPEK